MDLPVSQTSLEEAISAEAAGDPLLELRLGVGVAESLETLGQDLVFALVQRAKRSGHSWKQIAAELAVTRQAAQKRYGVRGENRVETRQRARQDQHTGKYRPLWQWLIEQHSDAVNLTFADVERVLGFPLPPSSRNHPAHWSGYDGSAVARAIVDAGWRAEGVDLNAQRLTLRRTRRT